ncbi:hypothetical protein Tco_0870524 [Tanacetum coccineum]
MTSTRASISKASKRPKINIILLEQLFVDLTHDDPKNPLPKHQLSSPSAPNAPLKTPSTKVSRHSEVVKRSEVVKQSEVVKRREVMNEENSQVWCSGSGVGRRVTEAVMEAVIEAVTEACDVAVVLYDYFKG